MNTFILVLDVFQYLFVLTVKTQPPDKPTVNGNNIFWSRGVNFPSDIENYEFQVQFKPGHLEWEVSMPFVFNISLDPVSFNDRYMIDPQRIPHRMYFQC